MSLKSILTQALPRTDSPSLLGSVEVLAEVDADTDTAVVIVVDGRRFDLSAEQAVELGTAILWATDTRTSQMPDAAGIWRDLGDVFIHVSRWVRPKAGTVCGVVEVLAPNRVTIERDPVSAGALGGRNFPRLTQ